MDAKALPAELECGRVDPDGQYAPVGGVQRDQALPGAAAGASFGPNAERIGSVERDMHPAIRSGRIDELPRVARARLHRSRETGGRQLHQPAGRLQVELETVRRA